MIKFKDLEFEKTFGGVGATHTFNNGITISVQAGSGIYSTPKENLTSSDEYSSFEVAMWDEDREWVTRDFLFDYHDNVLGWQDRDEINALMLLIQDK
jgi:hypothetical protein